MRQLNLKRVLSDEEDVALREPIPQHGGQGDYDPLYSSLDGEEIKALKDDGSILFWLIPGVFERHDLDRAFQHLKTVKGDCATRTEVTGTQRVMRPRRDGTISRQYRAPESVVKDYRKRGCRADILGFTETPHCRQTAWTAKNPDVLKNTWPLINGANRIFKEYIPDRYNFQYYHACESPDFQLGNTAFSTVTVNRRLSTTYHRDEGDLQGGFGVMFTLGEFKGAHLIFPAFRVAVDYQPGSLILADVHETHGNCDNLKGDRITCVLYVRERINKCGIAEDVEKQLAGKLSVHARED